MSNDTASWIRVGLAGIYTLFSGLFFLFIKRYLAKKDAEETAKKDEAKKWRDGVDRDRRKTERRITELAIKTKVRFDRDRDSD